MPVVSCIVKDDRYSKHESIQYIGGLNADRTRWKLSQQDAISAIETGKYGDFYVDRPKGDRVKVIVATRLGSFSTLPLSVMSTSAATSLLVQPEEATAAAHIPIIHRFIIMPVLQLRRRVRSELRAYCREPVGWDLRLRRMA